MLFSPNSTRSVQDFDLLDTPVTKTIVSEAVGGLTRFGRLGHQKVFQNLSRILCLKTNDWSWLLIQFLEMSVSWISAIAESVRIHRTMNSNSKHWKMLVVRKSSPMSPVDRNLIVLVYESALSLHVLVMWSWLGNWIVLVGHWRISSKRSIRSSHETLGWRFWPKIWTLRHQAECSSSMSSEPLRNLKSRSSKSVLLLDWKWLVLVVAWVEDQRLWTRSRSRLLNRSTMMARPAFQRSARLLESAEPPFTATSHSRLLDALFDRLTLFSVSLCLLLCCFLFCSLRNVFLCEFAEWWTDKVPEGSNVKYHN